MGKIIGTAIPRMQQPKPGTIIVDAMGGFAHPAYQQGEAALIAAATKNGIAVLGVANAYACGVLGYFADRLARAVWCQSPSPMRRPRWRPGGARRRSLAPTPEPLAHPVAKMIRW